MAFPTITIYIHVTWIKRNISQQFPAKVYQSPATDFWPVRTRRVKIMSLARWNVQPWHCCPRKTFWTTAWPFQLPEVTASMVQTSKTGHFLNWRRFDSASVDGSHWFWYGWKALDFSCPEMFSVVDSVLRIWIKQKKSLIGCWAPTATTFGQSAPSRVQLTTGRNGHNHQFDRPSLVSSVCRRVYEKNRAVRVVGRVFR